jgi:hypothetical protein
MRRAFPRLRRMKGVILAAVGVLVAVMVLTVGAWWSDENLVTIQCDGSLPVWMLEAQNYDGGGCAEPLPFWQAPPNADWTEHCMGMCAGDNPWPIPSR